jgi:hypothetical protein
MDSLVIYNDRTWNRWSGRGNRKGGSQIDFLLEFGNASSVPEAVQLLLEFKGEPIKDVYHEAGTEARKPRELVMPPKNTNYRRLYAYLMQTRGLSQEVVSYFVKNNLIYEDAVHHNVVYCGYDPDGNIRYGGLRGTADVYGKKFKMDVPGNDKNYGVNIVNRDSDELKVFESVIDCMSYMDLYNDYSSNKLVLGMVADNPLEQFLKDYDHVKKITFCLDNDAAGQQSIYGFEYGLTDEKMRHPGLKEKYEAKGFEVSVDVPPEGKDFNETLLARKNGSKKEEKTQMTVSNADYVRNFYDDMMDKAGFRRKDISGEAATVEYVSKINYNPENKNTYYASDGYGDIHGWIMDNPEISAAEKVAASQANEVIRKINIIKNKQGSVGFYMENRPEEKFVLANSEGKKYTDGNMYRLYYEFDGLLTAKEMDALQQVCKSLDSVVETYDQLKKEKAESHPDNKAPDAAEISRNNNSHRKVTR